MIRSRPRCSTISLAFSLFLLIGSGCSATRQGYEVDARAELLSDRPPPPGRTCRVVPVPSTLPAPADLVNEVELVESTRDLLRAHPDSRGFVLFSMVYDRFGSNIRREVIEHSLGSAVVDSIQKLVFAHRQTMPESDEEWGVRLRMDVADSINLRVGRQERCEPVPRDVDLAYAIQHTHGAGTRMRGGSRESIVWIRLTVSPRGTVTRAEIERGSLSSSMLMQSLLEYTRSFFFHPALEDGFPATGTITVPLRVRDR